ncbi:MAG: hypothetical protein COB36_10815 [Alphaproteobacteria bacterium]|nr:MAG: hypothetical protein COB36_10815 [Alphaproteobacteria bacterium]
MSLDFEAFPKMARLSREIIITEKIDGTNAQICIGENGEFLVGSRKRWITPEDDNYGFARWAHENKDDLMTLGHGRHFGEWWGQGIQRRYDMDRKAFSLFNVSRWAAERPECCDVVPILYRGDFSQSNIELCLDGLKQLGSLASPGFMNPEGVIVFHTAANIGFKKTIHKDEIPKSLAALTQP